LKDSVQPAPEWGPALPEYREKYIATLSRSRKNRILRRINDDNNGKEENGAGLMQMDGEDPEMRI
jgi:hypothetical protein